MKVQTLLRFELATNTREHVCLRMSMKHLFGLTCWLLDIERYFGMMKTKGEHNILLQTFSAYLSA